MYNISIRTLKRELEGSPVVITKRDSKETGRGTLHFDTVLIDTHQPASVTFFNYDNEDYLITFCKHGEIFKETYARKSGACSYILRHSFGYNAQDFAEYIIHKCRKRTKFDKLKKLT